MNSEKKIIFAVAVFLVFSFAFLFYAQKHRSEVASDAGWELYFAEPKSVGDLNFVVKNGGKKTKFSWKEALENGTVIKDGEMELLAGEEQKIILEQKNFQENVLIEVTGGGEKKEIYKN